MAVNLVSEALTFMLLGMGIVFVFIILMIIAMNLQRAFVEKCLPDAPSGPASKGGSVSAHSADAASKKKNKVAAIVAAICHHQQAK